MVKTLAIAGVFAGCLVALAAKAHEAPMGWQYDPGCCSGKDCAMVKASAIRESAEGATITLNKGEHPMLIAPFTAFVPWGSDKLKNSQDGEWHVCIGTQWKARDGRVFDGQVYCVYQPPRGM